MQRSGKDDSPIALCKARKGKEGLVPFLVPKTRLTGKRKEKKRKAKQSKKEKERKGAEFCLSLGEQRKS